MPALSIALWLAGVVTPVTAQDTTTTRDSLAADSLARRLERAEEAIRLLQQQLAAESESKVRARSGAALELSGRVLMNAFSNSRRTNNSDVPTFVRPDTAGRPTQGGAGMAIRQTTLALALTGGRALGAALDADLDVDFFGGQQPSSGGRTFPLLRLRTARATLRWSHAELLVGQESPLTSGPNPRSLAAVGTPAFTAAGNLWFWLPQVRATVQTAGPVSLGLQGAVLAPMSGDPQGAFDTDFDLAERSRRPFVQGRARLRWGSDDMVGEVGIGVHRGWLASPGDTLLDSRALTADLSLPVTGWLEIRGEWFDGQGLRGLGGGGVGQLLGTRGRPVRTRGGWGQLTLRPHARVRVGGGYGLDDPRDDDVLPGGRLRNTASQAHLEWRVGGGLLVGLEWRRMETTYAPRRWANDHLNLAVGWGF